VQEKDKTGKTPLQLAADYGNTEVLRELLRCGAPNSIKAATDAGVFVCGKSGVSRSRGGNAL
jgi:ankyrin repeat protein